MISYLSGTIKEIQDNTLTVVISGIGYAVQVTNPGLYAQGTPIELSIYTHWNQEQGPSLFGFNSGLDRTVFLLIISCSGIGPKIGLAALANLSAQGFLEAVQTGNEKALSSISGVGAKKAEQIIVHLKHKVAKLIESGTVTLGSSNLEQWHHISEVLKSLNYSKQEISATVNFLTENYGGTSLTFDQLMRHALSFLAKK